MEEKLCYGCMQYKQQSPVCELCGYDERQLNEQNQLPVGTVLQGQYVVGRVLGQGGFGITYAGWDRLLQIPVAIKEYFPMGFVHRDLRNGPQVECNYRDREVFEKHRDRFLKEARTLAQLSSVPEIVQINNFFVANETAYIVMEYVRGITLKNYLKKLGRPLRTDEALQIMDPVLRGLGKVHDQQLIHRDISPDNIMLSQEGGVKIIDFGTARNMDEGMRSRSTESILKPGFAPLEQYNTKGNLGTWTDVYAVCATFHYLLTGKLPPDAPSRIEEGETLPLLDQVPDIPARVRKALQKGLAVRIADRMQNLTQLQAQLYPKDQKPETAPKKERKKPETTPKEVQKKPEKVKPETGEKKQQSRQESAGKKRFPLIPVLAAVLVLAVLVLVMPGKDRKDVQIRQPETVRTMPPAEISGTDREQPAEQSREPVEQNREPVELTVMAAQYGSYTGDWWADFVQDFEAAYPHVDLTVDVVSWMDIYTVVDSSVESGKAPDILNIDVYRDYQAKGLLLPVTEYLSPETYNDIYPYLLEQSVADGQVWAIPDLCSTRVMYCNMDILNAVGMEVPTTWQELMTVCEAIKAYNPNLYPWGMDMTTDDGHACFVYYTLNNGGGFLDAAGNWDLDSAANVEAVRFAANMVQSGLTNPDPTVQSRYDLQDLFLAGKVAMMISTENMFRIMEQNGGNLHYQVAPIPVNGSNPSRSLVVTDRFMVFDNRYSEAEREAITCFFDFFYEAERYEAWTAMEYFLPVTRSGARVLDQRDTNPAVWETILDNGVLYPAEKAEWMMVKQGVIDVQQQVLLGGDPESLLRILQASVT